VARLAFGGPANTLRGITAPPQTVLVGADCYAMHVEVHEAAVRLEVCGLESLHDEPIGAIREFNAFDRIRQPPASLH